MAVIIIHPDIFSLCGKLPVCTWIRPAKTFLKRYSSQITSGWDNEARNTNIYSKINDARYHH